MFILEVSLRNNNIVGQEWAGPHYLHYRNMYVHTAVKCILELRLYTIVRLNMVYVNPVFVCVYRCIGTVIYPGLHACQFQLLHTASVTTRKLYNITIISMQCTFT